MGPIFTWLQVSDIHFGHGDASEGWDQRLVVSELTSDIVKAINKICPRPDVVLLTGDIAFSGGSRRRPGPAAIGEYHEAKEWLSGLLHDLALPPERAFIVPGNHDIQRDVAVADRNINRLLESLRSGRDKIDTVWSYPEDAELLKRRQANYLEFASTFGAKTQHPYWMEQLPTTGNVTIRLVGLNSVLLSAGDDDYKKLELGNEQLVNTLLRPLVKPNEIVVVMTHHPFAWLKDEAGVSQVVQRHAHVHLCGHVHQAESERVLYGGGADFVRIVAGAVHDLATPGSRPLRFGYNFGAIHAEADGSLVLQVWPRIWSPANRDFRTDIDNVPDGQLYALHGLRFHGSSASASALIQQSTQAQASTRVGLVGTIDIADPVERVRFMRQLADDFAQRGENQTAASLLVAALEVASKIRDTRVRTTEMTDLALALAHVGQSDQARIIVSDAGITVRDITDPVLKAAVANEVGTSVTRLESLASEQRSSAAPQPPTAAVSTDKDTAFGKASASPMVRRVRIFVSSPSDVSAEAGSSCRCSSGVESHTSPISRASFGTCGMGHSRVPGRRTASSPDQYPISKCRHLFGYYVAEVRHAHRHCWKWHGGRVSTRL
jgi:hypothetical protein